MGANMLVAIMDILELSVGGKCNEKLMIRMFLWLLWYALRNAAAIIFVAP